MVPFPSLLGRRVQQILSWSGGKLHTLSHGVRLVLGGCAILVACVAVILVQGNIGARATTRHFDLQVRSYPSSPPSLSAPWLNRNATIKQGASMNRTASRMLSTVAAIAGGIVQVNLPSVASPVLSPNPHVHQATTPKPTPVSDATVQVTRAATGGPLISISCNNAPIRSAIAKLFQAAGTGYSLSNNVSGNVTLNVRSLPTDAVLRVILRSSEQPLAYDIIDNVYYIKARTTSQIGVSGTAGTSDSAAPYIAQARLSGINLIQYKVLIDNMSCTAMADRLNGDDIRRAGLLPLQLHIVAVKADNSLLITATPDDFAKVKDIIKNLDLPVQQAQIRVTFVDVAEADLRNIGLTLQSVSSDPRSKENASLVQALQQGKLPAGQTYMLTTANGVQSSVTMTPVIGNYASELDVTPSFGANGIITTHLEIANDSDYTEAVNSGETVLVAARSEPLSRIHLIFLQATTLPLAGDPKTATQPAGVTKGL